MSPPSPPPTFVCLLELWHKHVISFGPISDMKKMWVPSLLQLRILKDCFVFPLSHSPTTSLRCPCFLGFSMVYLSGLLLEEIMPFNLQNNLCLAGIQQYISHQGCRESYACVKVYLEIFVIIQMWQSCPTPIQASNSWWLQRQVSAGGWHKYNKIIDTSILVRRTTHQTSALEK